MSVYVLALVLYFADGTKEKHDIYKTYEGDKCVDVRDGMRGGLSKYNDLIEKDKKPVDIKTKQVLEYVDVECHNEKKPI